MFLFLFFSPLSSDWMLMSNDTVEVQCWRRAWVSQWLHAPQLFLLLCSTEYYKNLTSIWKASDCRDNPTLEQILKKALQISISTGLLLCTTLLVYTRPVTSVVSNSLWPHWLYSPPGSSLHEILQTRILEWTATPSSRKSSRGQARISCTAGRFFTHWVTWEAH